MAAAITSIIGLQNLTNLQDFRADWNSLSAVNLSGLPNLTYVDISDNEIPGTEGQHSLTSVNLSGSTALQELRLDDSNFSAGIPNLTGLINLGWLDMDQCGITGNVDLSILPALYGFDLSGNTGLTSVTIFEQVLESVNISNCALTEASVNDILGWLDGGGYTNGFVDLSGGTNAIPTGSGLTAVTNLQNKGWNVIVNIASYSWNLVGDNSYSCASMVSIPTVYTSVSTLGDGVYIYTDEALTIPYSGYTYVSNNTTIWVISSGMLAAGGPC